MLNPALAALTLGLVSSAAVAERLGRNARFAAIGSGVGAALMGACGTWVSSRAVFWLAASLCVPALIALRSLGGPSAAAGGHFGRWTATHEPLRARVLLDRRLLAYVVCTMLFHLANAAMLPLAGVEITSAPTEHASLIIAACILVPQLMVALLSPFAGRAAQTVGAAKRAAGRFLRVAGACVAAGVRDGSAVDRSGAGAGRIWVARRLA